MRKKDILIIGAGGVAHVAAHKVAQNNDILGDLCIASRTLAKCDAIIESIKRKKSAKNPRRKIYSRQIDAMDVPALVQLIEETKSDIVINLGQSFINMSVLEACIQTGAAYMDTAIHEEPDKVCEDPPWYANYEWKRKDRCREKGITAILGVGFDPGRGQCLVRACRQKPFRHHRYHRHHGRQRRQPRQVFRHEFRPGNQFQGVQESVDLDRPEMGRTKRSTRSRKVYEFPVVGKQTLYLTGHDELHSLSKNIDANSIRFWMGFSATTTSMFLPCSRNSA